MDDSAPLSDGGDADQRDALKRARRARLSWRLAAAVTMAAALVPALLWAGDISWMNDEPRLLAKAYHANARVRPETQGLSGNFGIPYGPLPTQIYQLLLLITHDPVLLATIRAGLCAGATALALLWLARSLRLNPWFAAAVVLAPYVWMYNRILWDASFAIPIGSLALAAYAAFLRTGSGRSLVLSVACLMGILFIHPQDLPLFAPLAGHMLWRHRPALRRHRAGIAAVLLVTLALNAFYVPAAVMSVANRLSASVQSGYPDDTPRREALLTAFRGGALLGGYHYVEIDSRLRGRRELVQAAKFASSIVYPLIWIGIGVAGVRFLRHRRGAYDFESHDPADPTLRDARRAVFGIALVGLALLLALYGVMKMPAHPQYFFGTFILHALLAWIGVDALSRLRLGGLATAVYGSAVAYITLASMWQIHHEGYDRETDRPTLANQVEVARGLNRYADERVHTDVLLFRRCPQALRSLRLLIPPDAGAAPTRNGRLVIRNASGPTGVDCAIELTEAGRELEIPGRWELMNVTPLPDGWQPGQDR
jgi:hypothetical protein